MKAGDRPKDMPEWMRWVEMLLAQLDSRMRGVALVYGAGNTVTTTDGSGHAGFIHGAGASGAPVVVASGGNGETVTILAVNTFGFTAAFTNGAGTPIASTPVRCLWIAMPPTT